MEEEKRAEIEHDFILVLEKYPYIQELKKRIEVGNLELNLSVIQKELQRLYQLNPDDMTTKYKLIWFGKYFKGIKGLDRLRTVNNLIMKDVYGEERLNRAKSQGTMIDFLVTNNIKTIEELKELNQIESLTPIEHEKLLLNRYKKPIIPPQFTGLYTQEQLLKLYTGLTNGSFLPKDSTGADFKSFCYILGDGKQEDFKYLDWIGYIKDLNAFINTFYNGERAKWKKTVSSFKWENNLINQNSLKTANDAYDKDPPSTDYFKILKKNIQ